MRRRRKIPGLVIVILLVAVIAAEGGMLASILSGRGVFQKKPEAPRDWRLVLVNTENPVPEDYETELTELFTGVSVDSRVYPDLQRMFDDARAQGVWPIAGEGYRSHADQARMMQSYIDRYLAQGSSQTEAEEMARQYVAEPGTSEHELGIALDINAAQGESEQAVYDWLAENAYRYGFILRYPQGKEDITGFDYEPWHYRYVGEEAAQEIYDGRLTLEEYLEEGR